MRKPVSVTIKNPEEITILATGGTIDKFYSVAGTMDIGAVSYTHLAADPARNPPETR